MTKKTPKAPSKKSPEKTELYIIGESPLVEEYAELCAGHGYEVLVHWNNAPTPIQKFDSDIRVSASVPATVSVGIELTNTDIDRKRKNLERLDKALPAMSVLLSSSVAVSASEQASWVNHKHRVVGIGAMPTFTSRPLVEVAPTIFTPKETLEVVARFYLSVGKEIVLVQDRVGMVLPRILCQLVNESAFAVTEDVATPQDIDTAMKLGVNYPYGPIEWAERIGLEQVYAVLSALERDLKEDRYRVSPLLRQMALGGDWWQHH